MPRKLDLDQQNSASKKQIADIEEEKQSQEESQVQEQADEKPIQYRYLYLLKSQLKLDKEVEIQRESLFSYEAFNTIDAFKMFDQGNKGYITDDDIREVCINQGIKIDWLEEPDKLSKFITKYDRDHDHKLNYIEFTKAITPKSQTYVRNYNKFSRSYVSEKDQHIR